MVSKKDSSSAAKTAAAKALMKEIEKKGLREVFLRRVEQRWGDLIDAKLDLALGVKVVDPELGRVYLRTPSAEALKYIADQAMGKAKDVTELTSSGSLDKTIDTLGKILKS